MPSQSPYPVGHELRDDASDDRRCTFHAHAGDNPLPATAENFPVRKSGAKEGQFVGWCASCCQKWQKEYRDRKSAGIVAPRDGSGRPTAPKSVPATFGLLPGSYVAPVAPKKVAAKKVAKRFRQNDAPATFGLVPAGR